MIPDNLVDEGLNALIDYLAARQGLDIESTKGYNNEHSRAVQEVTVARDRVRDVLQRISEAK